MKAHGIGVHTPSEIDEFGKNDLQVLSDLLGSKDFFFGDKPTTVSIHGTERSVSGRTMI